MITTAILNDPKPARGVNWAGHPMKEGEDYYGKTVTDAQQNAVEAPTARSNPVPVSQPRKRRRGRKSAAVWTAEKRAAIGARMRAWHAQRKQGTTSDNTPNVKSINVEPQGLTTDET